MRFISCLLLIMILSGCASGDGEYYTSHPHNEREVFSPESSSEDITGYYSLRGALLNMVSLGVSDDVLRISAYAGDLDDDLHTIIQQLTTEEPIGIYGVQSISAEQARVLSLRELTVHITYKRDSDEMQSVTSVSGIVDLENRLMDMYSSFSTGGAFYLNDTSQYPGDLRRTFYSSWMKCGSHAIGLLAAEPFFYPESGRRQIVEIRLTYLEDRDRLEKKASEVQRLSSEVCEGFSSETQEEILRSVNTWLMENVELDAAAQRVVDETQAAQPKGDSYTAYGVFVQGRGAQPAFALAASILCSKMGIENTVVTGYVGENIYSWLQLEVDGREMLYDPTGIQNGREEFLYTLQEASALFIPWE